MNIKKYAFAVLFVGIATFAAMLFLTAMSGGEIVRPAEYPNEQGFTQAIFFFEFLNNPQEVQLALGDPKTDEGKSIRQAMDALNTYDFLFMVLYPLLIAVLILFLHKKIIYEGYEISQNRLLMWMGAIFAVLMCLSDLYENIQLFKISSFISLSAISDDLIGTLRVTTRIKNITIGGGTLILIYFYTVYFKKSWKLLLPLIYLISVLISVVAITFSSQRYLIEVAATLGMFGWLVSTIHAGYWSFKAGKA